ncbi:hypothetical protein BKC07_14550 [Peribacillus simplex]|nr:hypothetical protein BKC07_14550 [Peribacillus simplex]
MAASRRKGSGFLKSTGTFLEKNCKQTGFLRICLLLEVRNSLIPNQDFISKLVSLMLFFSTPHWMEEIYDTPAEYLASQDPGDA